MVTPRAGARVRVRVKPWSHLEQGGRRVRLLAPLPCAGAGRVELLDHGDGLEALLVRVRVRGRGRGRVRGRV